MKAPDLSEDGRLARLDASGVELLGYSVAGEQTFVTLPAMSLSFDIGRCPPAVLAADVVALSHGHADHAAGLLYYMAQRYRTKMGPGTVLCHRDLAETIRRLAECAAELEGHTTPVNVVALAPDEAIELGEGRRLRAFETHHTVPSLGFLVESDGEDRPTIAYTGDTGWGECFLREDVLAARVLVTELTFFRRGERRFAAESRHLHLDHLKALAVRSGAETIVLTHLPRRTAVPRVARVVQHALPEHHRGRVALLMAHTDGASAPAEATHGLS